ncbi:YwdI family protein [Anaerobacillus sp. MEB173]|uniref:YwdI family protein n=1 Tax=Anaerobacillus sp. MEB173 TaxID=3383345 RepID=UPI003F8F9292
MEIPVSVLVDKIATQVQQLKEGVTIGKVSEREIRESASVIKAYCELILEATHIESSHVKTSRPIQIEGKRAGVKTTDRKLVDDDANGDSLLDF